MINYFYIYTKIVIVVCSLFWAGNLFGQTPIVLENDWEVSPEVAQFLQIYEDIDGGLNIKKVSSNNFQSQFIPYAQFKNAIKSNSCYWGKLSLQNVSKNFQNIFLTLNTNSFVELYLRQNDSTYNVKYAGEFVKESLKEVMGFRKDCAFKILIEPNQTKTIFFKVRTITGFKPNILPKLVHEKNWIKNTNHTFIKQSFFHGVLWIILLLSLIVYLVNRDKTYLYYGLYVLSVSLYFLWSFGFTSFFIFPDYPFVNSYIWSILLLCTTFYFFFFRAFLETKKHIPFWDKIIKESTKISLITFIAVIALQKLTSQSFYPIRISNIVVFGQLVFGLVMLTRIPKHIKTFNFVLVGSVVLVIGGIASILLHFFRLDAYAYFFQLGVLLEMVVFSLGLGYKIKLNEEKKRHAQIELIKQLKQNKILQDKINEDLEGIVQERTEEIQSINQNLEEIVAQRTAELDLFLYRTSHDLKGPLARFEGLIQLAFMEKNKPTKEFWDGINFTIQKMGKTLEKLMAISTINKAFDKIQEIKVENLVMFIKEKFNYKEGSIDFKFKDDATIFSNLSLIQLILNSLVDNAFIFCIQTPKIKIEFVESTKNEFILIISDNGIGIKSEFIPNIFDMFFIGSLMSEGNGLGLYIADKAIKKLNGVISLESIEEEGTTFTITIPVKTAEQNSLHIT
ncbi:MAG: sensor histidine kinase [Flammeovirgaceae bacterium]|nr:sensor histidine kinase [Flammeovirgaceae bacterium]